MKKRELIEIIRTAVRAELTECLPTLISECLNNNTTTTSRNTDPVELTKSILGESSKKKKIRTPKKTSKTDIQFSRNSALNEALNATAGGIPQEGSTVSGIEVESTSVKDFQGQEVNVDSLPDHISNALTRNYSDVLSAIDKKKGGG